MPQETPADRPAPRETESRRNFTAKIAAFATGAVVVLSPLAVGLFAFLDPLFRRKRLPEKYAGDGSGQEGYYRVAALDALAPGGPPQRFPVVTDAVDGWNVLPDQSIGAVYIQRTGPEELRVFNATCPHAGCSVACDGNAFHCPCHNSSFNLDGSKRESMAGRENPSRRGLDSLDVDPDLLAEGEIWVEYKNFYTGVEEKKPKI